MQEISTLSHTPTPTQLANDLAAVMQLFWGNVAELEADELATVEVIPGWTTQAIVAHVAFWDDYQRQRMEAAISGVSRGGYTRPVADNDARALADNQRPWAEVVGAAQAARARLVAFARDLPPAALTQEFMEGEKPFSLLKQLQHMVRHVHQHRLDIQRYSGSLDRWGRPRLRTLLEAQHKNFMDSIGGLSEETLLTTPVCGDWSIRDVLAHVLSWHEYCAVVTRHWPQPEPSAIAHWVRDDGSRSNRSDSWDTINARLLAGQADLNLIDIADGLTTYHRKLMRAFDRASDDTLRSVGYAWGDPAPLSCFIYEAYVHAAEHGAQIWAFRAGQTTSHLAT